MTELSFNDYQLAADEFAAYPDTELGNMYPVFALAEEAGEVVGKFAKAIRKGVPVDEQVVAKELGDVLWNLAAVATLLDLNLEDIAVDNILKLKDRRERNVLVGEGDDR